MAEGDRTLFVRESGHADGVPVLVHHGTPGSRILYYSWIDDALSRGIRLISYDRPGYGGSTPRPGRTVASAAEDAAAIASHLNIDRLLTWGASGGGPFALACATLLPDLVAGAAAIASLVPAIAEESKWDEGMGEESTEELDAAVEGQDEHEDLIEQRALELLDADAQGLLTAFNSVLSPVDAAVLTKDFAEFLVEHLRTGIKDTRAGWIEDSIAFSAPWGFELNEVQIPVLLMHGKQDLVVPFSNGEWLAQIISGADTRLSADDGHFTLTAAGIPKVHAWLLEQLN